METDILIVGGGPVGIFTVFQAGVLGLKTILVDSLPELGGQCTALYPEKFIYDIPGHPKIIASELIEKLIAQAEKFSPIYQPCTTVNNVKKNSDYFAVKTNKNHTIKCKAIIIAAGAGAFDYNKIPLPNIAEFENKSLFYSIRKQEIFANKIVAIAGGGDSAADWAVILADTAKKVYLIHRRDKFRCMDATSAQIQQLITDKKIELVTPFTIKNIIGKNEQIHKIILNNFSGEERVIDAEYLLAFFGLKTYLEHIKTWGLELHNHHIVVNKENYATNIDGIYAVGDIATYNGKLKLILTGFAESATACHDILKSFFSNRPYNFTYSTNMEILS